MKNSVRRKSVGMADLRGARTMRRSCLLGMFVRALI